MVFWRIVKQYERMVVLRWGKFMDVRGPGLRLVVPFIDQPVKVDIREQVDRVPTQKYITSDNVVVDMDFVIYYRVLQDNEEVRKAVMDIENYRMATINLSFATLRAVIGATTLSEALSERERIRDQLQLRMDEVTGRWGIKVSQVEINEIDPPPGVKAAMEREKSAAAIKTAENHGIRRRAPGGHQPRRGREAVGDTHGGGRAAGGDTERRGRPAGGHPPRRGLQHGAGPDKLRCGIRGLPDYEPPVL